MAILSVRLSDLYISFIFLCLLIALLFITDLLYKKYTYSHLFLRKFVHLIVGILVVLASFYLESSIPIIVISILFCIINFFSIKKHKFTSIHGKDKSYGTVYYPISIFLLAVLFWNKHLIIFQISTLVMAVSDALAAIIGDKYGKIKFIILKDRKSIAGSLTMYLSTIIIIFLFLVFSIDLSLTQIIIISLAVGCIATASELISANGSDNLTVPVFTSLFLYVLINDPNFLLFNQIISGIIFSLILAFTSTKLKYLSSSGAITTFILGSIIFGLGGIPYAMPILAFFIFSSLLSFIGKKGKYHVEKYYEKSSTRDHAQVIANGGVAGILVIFNYLSPSDFNYIVYLSVVAASTADTWATEIGFFSKKLPRLITNLKTVSKGTSGAISILGTIAAISGAFLILFVGLLFISSRNIDTYNLYLYAIVIVISGTFACFFDSLLGATIQAQYKCQICGKITEKNVHCNKNSTLKTGKNYIRNDSVNFLSSIFSVIISLTIIYLFNWK